MDSGPQTPIVINGPRDERSELKMNTYNLAALDDKEFEAFAVDLIGREIGVRIERFKSGTDKGVDGRWFITETQEAVVQCKHWIRSGFAKLLSEMKKTEKPKIVRLKPARYILITSVELSRHNKQALLKQLAPYVLSERDIYGSEDIHDLLARHPEVEKRHYKLWLTSATALSHIFNNAIAGRSAFNSTKITEKLPLIVKTDDLEDARSLLSQRHVIIITGVPGIGKTTLAEQLLIELLADGFELIYLEQNVSEAELPLLTDKKQVLYSDDFLGRNILEALERKFDSHIVGLINRVCDDKTKRFLLTSRTNILNQGKHLTDLIALNKIEKNEFEVRIEKLSRWDKARILYSHIWHSKLPDATLDELFKDKRYRTVIDHRNFNPRLISFITDSDKAERHGVGGYWKYVTDTLENPKDIWAHFFDAQLSQECRDLVYLVVFNSRSIAEAALLNSFRESRAIVAGNEGKVEHDVTVALKICVGSVLNRLLNPKTGHVEFELFNPSIADYVYGSIRNWAVYRRYFAALRSRSSLRSLVQLKSARMVDEKAYRAILDTLAEAEAERGHIEPDSYAVELAEMLVEHDGTRTKHLQLIHNVVNGVQFALCGDCYLNLMWLTTNCLAFGLVEDPIARATELVGNLDAWAFTYDDASVLANIIRELPEIGREAVENVARKHVKYLWSEYVSEYVRDADVLDEIYSEDQFLEASKLLRDSVSDALVDTGFEFTPQEVTEICSNVNLEVIAQRNIDRSENSSDDSYVPPRREKDGQDEMIDDLFERDERRSAIS